MRRDVQTRDGHTVSLVRLELRSPYYGAVEITRIETATAFLLKEAVKRGDMIFGADPNNPPRQLPAEVVVAELHSSWLPNPNAVDFAGDYRTECTLRIFQDSGRDPLAAVAAAAANIDWAHAAKVVCWT